MLEVVFSDSHAAAMSMAFGHKNLLGGAAAVIFARDEDGTIDQAELEKFQREAQERERRGWENAMPLEGDPKNIINLPLALSVGNITEAGIGKEREAALSLLMGIFPGLASQVVNELLSSARERHAQLLKQAQNGEPIRVWGSHEPNEACGLYWLMEQLRPIGLEKLEVTLVELPAWERRSDGCIVQHTGWGEVEPYRLGEMALLGKKLPANYLYSLANHWRELQQENAVLRAVLNGKLVSAPESLYDAFILRELAKQEDEFMEARLVGQVLGKYQLGISDAWIALRIEQFIQDGRLIPVTTPAPDDPVYHRILRKAKR